MHKEWFVKDLEPGLVLKSPFILADKQLGRQRANTRNPNKPFLRLTLMDSTGSIPAMAWENAEEMGAGCTTGDLVMVEGQVSQWNGRLQLEVRSLSRLAKDQATMADFFPVSPRPQQEMEAELKRLIESVSNPHLAALLASFWQEDDFYHRFVNSTAAVSVHHAYRAGLLEHVLETSALALAMQQLHQEFTNRDLLLTACLLHDVGKLDEYREEPLSYTLTSQGRLFGHPLLGLMTVAERIRKISGFPEDLGQELLHCIASHHGEKEWGAIETPRTMNAFILHWSDLASARLNQFAALYRNHEDPKSTWTKRDNYLGTDAYTGFLEQPPHRKAR